MFNSIPFLISFAVFYLIYLSSNRKIQNLSLFIFGLYFYTRFDWKMGIILLLAVCFNFYLAKFLHKHEGSKRKKILLMGVIANLFLLAVFKYTLFLLGVFDDIMTSFDSSFSIWKPEILLPVGVSFYTFHNISYLVELYNRKIEEADSLLEFAIYDLFFPLLLAGPIERPGSLLPQIKNPRVVTKIKFFSGISLFLWGVFLKANIADPLASYVDSKLVSYDSLNPGILWIVSPAFAFQVYADFFGYSVCALGLSEMMGFNLMNNFHRPFFSTNPAMFWTRWHISLSSWLRDYVYIPLGGNRSGFIQSNINVMIVWILGGLWHGATYGYLVWGLYLGFCIVIYRLLDRFVLGKIDNKILSIFGTLFTFFSFSFGLLLFRISGTDDLVFVIKNIFSIDPKLISELWVLVYFLPILVFDIWQEKINTEKPSWFVNENPLRFLIIFSVFFTWFSLFAPFAKQEFFYFQF
ncbi:MBOAT family protein [Leptospira sp. 96542]|nr:MBOAT family protein [Leptospira sp. 96542]